MVIEFKLYLIYFV